MPQLRENVQRPRKRRLSEKPRPRENRVVLIGGVLISLVVVLACAGFFFRSIGWIPNTNQLVAPIILGGLGLFILMVVFFMYALRAGGTQRRETHDEHE